MRVEKENEILLTVESEGKDCVIPLSLCFKTNVYLNFPLASFIAFVVLYPIVLTFVNLSENPSPWNIMLYVLLGLFVIYLLLVLVAIPLSTHAQSKKFVYARNDYYEDRLHEEVKLTNQTAEQYVKLDLPFSRLLKGKETKDYFYLVFALQKRNQKTCEAILKTDLNEETTALLRNKIQQTKRKKK